MERKIQENYYLLLDLPIIPPVTDKKELKKAIEKKKREWIDGVNIGCHQMRCKKYCENIEEIEDALLTSDKQLCKIIKEALDIKTKELEKVLCAISKAGKITFTQFERLCLDFSCLSEDFIKSKIKLPIVAENIIFRVPPNPFAKFTDMRTMNAIQECLDILNKKDIYDFLGLPPTTSVEVFCQKADNILANDRRKIKKTSFDTAAKSLAGLVYTLFRKEEDKKAYDTALKIYNVNKEMADILKYRCIDRTIDWNSFKQSIDECMEYGMTKEEAEWYVYDMVILRKKCRPLFIIEENNA